MDPDGLSEPFSKDITLDDDRTLLPSLPLRQPVYCYFDPLDKASVGENDTETELLLMWRRAWWARGFKPVILGPDEAKSNPLYPKLQTLTINSALKSDLLRWLAWDTMEGGLLAHYTLFPMGTDYTFLPALRHGQYPVLARAGGLASGLFWGNNQDVHAALRKAVDSINADTASATTLLGLVNPDMIGEDDTPPVLAFYNATTIAKKYPKLLLDKNKPKFGRLRNQLINAHLQASWQNSYFLGIDLVTPSQDHTRAMLRNATDLAKALISCPPTPLAGSCPPNIAKCGPCGATTPPVVRTPKSFMNQTNVFTIGVVPHPWTRAVLANMQDGFNATWIREESERDPWLNTLSQALPGGAVSRYARLLQLKKVVAGGDTTDTRSLWITAEDPFPRQLDWHFGFAIPKTIIDDGKSQSPVPSDHIHDPDRSDLVRGPAVDEEMDKEEAMLQRARRTIALPRATAETRRRASIEAWNMADTEAWRFVRAAHDRRTMERKHWEDEQAKYTKGQRVMSDDGWMPGMDITGNHRKEDDQKAKARD